MKAEKRVKLREIINEISMSGSHLSLDSRQKFESRIIELLSNTIKDVDIKHELIKCHLCNSMNIKSSTFCIECDVRLKKDLKI